MAELTWDRVDFDRGVIDLRRDVGRRRKGRAVVPMNATVLAALSKAQMDALTEHVIEWAGKPVRSLRKSLATASERVGIEKVGHHIFRHSAAVWMAEAGVSISEIAQFLGHGDTKTTERVYARYSPTHLRGAADVLNLNAARRFK